MGRARGANGAVTTSAFGDVLGTRRGSTRSDVYALDNGQQVEVRAITARPDAAFKLVLDGEDTTVRFESRPAAEQALEAAVRVRSFSCNACDVTAERTLNEHALAAGWGIRGEYVRCPAHHELDTRPLLDPEPTARRQAQLAKLRAAGTDLQLAALNERWQDTDAPAVAELCAELGRRSWYADEERFDSYLDQVARELRLNRHYESPMDILTPDKVRELKERLADATGEHLKAALAGQGKAARWGRTQSDPPLPGEVRMRDLRSIAQWVDQHVAPDIICDMLLADAQRAESVVERTLYRPDYDGWCERYGNPGLLHLLPEEQWRKAIATAFGLYSRNPDRQPLRPSPTVRDAFETRLKALDRDHGLNRPSRS